MAIPANLDTVTVSGTYITADGSLATGTVSFTPTVWLRDDTGDVVVPQLPVVATLVNGEFTVELIATDDTDVDQNWAYVVTETINGATTSKTVLLPATSPTVDMAELEPVIDPTQYSDIRGPRGYSVLSGTTAPSAGTGEDGDHYYDRVAKVMYGPKAAGAWGSGTSLVGPTGATGAVGPQGPQGLTGPQGPQGIQGATGPQGPKGDTGDVGPAGPTGATGPQGPQGPKGDTGDLGSLAGTAPITYASNTIGLSVGAGLATSSGALVPDFGTTSGKVAQGNDSRFTDARTPTAHKSSHATGGSDALSPADIGAVSTSDSRLTDSRTPTAHKASHATGGTDALTPADIGAVANALVGVANGVASLDSSGQVPASQLGNASGAKAGGVIYENGQTIAANYSITSGANAVSAGPITIGTGISVTVPTGSSWAIV